MSSNQTTKSMIPLYDGMNKIPGGAMVIPLVLGSIIGTFFPEFLGLGSFTTALFKSSAGPLIALLIFSTGMQITLRSSGPLLAHTGVILLFKTIVPATLVTLLGLFIGNDGIWGISLLAMLTVVANSNGGIWLAFTGKYGDYRDRGAYIASAVNDGPFFVLLFLGASGLADIPFSLMLAAVLPLVIGMIIGNLDPKWTDLMKPTGAIVIPFFAFALGTGINLHAIVTGGATGIILGVLSSVLTGFLVFIGYKTILRRGNLSGIGFAAGTTAGNAIITPEIVAQADPTFAPFVQTATAQIAASVLVSAVIAPLLAAWVLKRQGGLVEESKGEN
ncbi:2-keto-3-deoxygluconate permease [Gallibacterium salpingitidis]|uniref:2-keto-3-deoxygluconate permease n=1 Tax=Gallibacterium salpingitidis TaxID=505341 RepID=A0AB36E3Q3_9PAST|nr:2-keto-3-deoxygluconate permease [Gallibacterium salpingitidis]OBX11133.1 2-keto-3-deoxygluconate permease [Gallibacterium salpingitidis]WKT00099.1 2-keto-3-deoxygluconate permease [Gallibacterium salpingitidis]